MIEIQSPDSILYENRILFLFGAIDEQAASRIIPMILVMNSLGQDPIKLYINSPGGDVVSGLAIYDTMRLATAPIYTVCIGRAASMAAWLLAAGDRGNRVASENAQIMIHQGRTLMGGTFTDLKINMQEFTRTQERMIRLLARHSGRGEADIAAAIERDHWMSAEEAVGFGIIDRVAPLR